MLHRTTLRNVCSAAAALVLVLAASSAHAQTSSPYTGTFLSTDIDTNADGLPAARQTLRVTGGPFGPSVLEGLDEFVIVGPTFCSTGNLGARFTLLVNPATPAALVQRFEETGDLLFMTETAGSGCADSVTRLLEVQVSGRIIDGTGAFAGATGTWSMTRRATFLFGNASASFGAQTGTFSQTIVRP